MQHYPLIDYYEMMKYQRFCRELGRLPKGLQEFASEDEWYEYVKEYFGFSHIGFDETGMVSYFAFESAEHQTLFCLKWS